MASFLSGLSDFLTGSAESMVADFLADPSTHAAWARVPKADVVAGLLERLADADAVNQRQSPYCGPTAFWRSLLLDDPQAYVTAVLDLYQTGRAAIGDLVVEPGLATRTSPPRWGLQAVDWITLGGLRDSENSVFSAAGWFGDSIAGITVPPTLTDWFQRAGYAEARNYAAVTHGLLKDWELWQHAQKAGVFQQQGYRVALFVDADVLSTSNQEDGWSMFPDHWIMLESAVGPAIPYYPEAKVRADVFTWGQTRPLAESPAQPVTEEGFVTKYYGFVAAKR